MAPSRSAARRTATGMLTASVLAASVWAQEPAPSPSPPAPAAPTPSPSPTEPTPSPSPSPAAPAPKHKKEPIVVRDHRTVRSYPANLGHNMVEVWSPHSLRPLLIGSAATGLSALLDDE